MPQGGVTHGCFVRVYLGGTPRVLRVLTPAAKSGDMLRVTGRGIDGGLSGAQKLAATLYRGAT